MAVVYLFDLPPDFLHSVTVTSLLLRLPPLKSQLHFLLKLSLSIISDCISFLIKHNFWPAHTLALFLPHNPGRPPRKLFHHPPISQLPLDQMVPSSFFPPPTPPPTPTPGSCGRMWIVMYCWRVTCWRGDSFADLKVPKNTYKSIYVDGGDGCRMNIHDTT